MKSRTKLNQKEIKNKIKSKVKSKKTFWTKRATWDQTCHPNSSTLKNNSGTKRAIWDQTCHPNNSALKTTLGPNVPSNVGSCTWKRNAIPPSLSNDVIQFDVIRFELSFVPIPYSRRYKCMYL